MAVRAPLKLQLDLVDYLQTGPHARGMTLLRSESSHSCRQMRPEQMLLRSCPSCKVCVHTGVMEGHFYTAFRDEYNGNTQRLARCLCIYAMLCWLSEAACAVAEDDGLGGLNLDKKKKKKKKPAVADPVSLCVPTACTAASLSRFVMILASTIYAALALHWTLTICQDANVCGHSN